MRFDLKKEVNLPILATEEYTITIVEGADSPQDMTIAMNNNLFVVDKYNIWIVEMDKDQVSGVSLFISGLIGPYNTIHKNSKVDLIVTDYGAGKVYGISENIFAIN